MRLFNGHDNYIDAAGNELPASYPNAIHRFIAYTSNFNGLSGSLGSTFNMDKNFYLKANIAQGFRAPNVAESGSNGIHDGTVVYEIGSPDLKPEKNIQIDFAAGVHSKDITAEIALFNNQVNRFIYPKAVYDSNGKPVLNNSTPGFPNAPVFKYTQGDAILRGGEVVLDIHPSTWPWLDFYAGYSLVDAYLKNQPDSTRNLPFIPPARLKSEVTFTAKNIGSHLSNTYFKIGLLHSFEQKNLYQQNAIYTGLSSYELQASQTPTQGYTLLNIGLGSDIVQNNHKLYTVFISIDNLADIPYMDYMSRFKYYPVNLAGNNRVGVYNMGRNASIKLIIPINSSKN